MEENSIKEDITKINTYVELVLKKDYCNCNELNIILGKHCDGSKNVAYAMQHILSDYKRVLKENEQLNAEVNSLKKENEELNEKILDNAGIYQLGFKDGEESYIKKVKDKIRKNEEIIDISNDGDLIHELYQKNKVYEELLESEK